MDFNRIQQSRITPVDPVKKALNNGLDKDGQDRSFEELLEKAMKNGPTNTDNVGMDPDTMAMIVASTKVIDSVKEAAPKREERPASTNENYNSEVASILAASTNIVRSVPKNPYGGSSKK